MEPNPTLRGVSPYQWLVLVVAWLGWVFDSMDATIYALVLQPALHDLLAGTAHGGEVPAESIAWYGGIIFSIFLVGWAAGGMLFGVIADRFGRTRTLIFTILIYAVFTGLAALSTTWWQLALYRFLTALGIGGEWAAGAALVAEAWPEDRRVRAAGILQSAWAAGFLFAALINLAIGRHGWRLMFLVGVVPAVVALFVRWWVREPERWVRAKERERRAGAVRPARLAELFRPEHRRATLVGSGLAFVAVAGLWGATNWTPTLVRALPALRGMESGRLIDYISYATMALNIGALAGYLAFGPLADRWGRRPVFALMCAGSLVMLPVTFLAPHSYGQVLAAAAAARILQQRHLQRIPDLPPGAVPDSYPCHGYGLLLQRRPGARGGRTVHDRLPRRGPGKLRPRGERGGAGLPRRPCHRMVRARDPRPAAAGMTRPGFPRIRLRNTTAAGFLEK